MFPEVLMATLINLKMKLDGEVKNQALFAVANS